jgi:hypothetical protein
LQRHEYNPIEIPDLEVSINLNEMIFQPDTPVDGATYSANIISVTNPLQFSWSLYSVGGSYSVELGPNGEDQPVWISASHQPTLCGDWRWLHAGKLLVANGSHKIIE